MDYQTLSDDSAQSAPGHHLIPEAAACAHRLLVEEQHGQAPPVLPLPHPRLRQRAQVDRADRGRVRGAAALAATVEAQTDRLLERIVETDNAAVVSAYEKKIAQCESRKLLLAERLASSARPHHAFEDVFELAMRFLSNPWNIGASGQLPLRRMVLRLAFAERVPYRRGEGFSNAKTSLLFSILREVGMGGKVMAHPTRFERVTFAFGGKT